LLELLLELLESELLLLLLLDPEPGIGGAAPGNGNWSEVDECFPSAGASGTEFGTFADAGFVDSPGKGN
jgi:hypothetical protein